MARWPQSDAIHTIPYRPHVARPPLPRARQSPKLRPQVATYGPAPSPTHGRQRHLAHKPHRGLASSSMPTSHARTWPVKQGPPATRGPCQVYMANQPHTDLASYTWPTSHTRIWPAINAPLATHGREPPRSTNQTDPLTATQRPRQPHAGLASHVRPTSHTPRTWPTTHGSATTHHEPGQPHIDKRATHQGRTATHTC